MLNSYSDEVPMDLSHILHSNDMKLVRHVKNNSYDYISKRLLTQNTDNRNSSSGRKEHTNITESNNNSFMTPPNHKRIFSTFLKSPNTEITELNNVREGEEGGLGPYKVERMNENLYKVVNRPKSNFYSPKVGALLIKSKNFNPFGKVNNKKVAKKPSPVPVATEKYDFVLNKKEPLDQPRSLILESKLGKSYSEVIGSLDKEFSAHEVPLARNKLKLSNRYIQKTVDEVFSEANTEFNFPLAKVKRKNYEIHEAQKDENNSYNVAPHNSLAETVVNQELVEPHISPQENNTGIVIQDEDKKAILENTDNKTEKELPVADIKTEQEKHEEPQTSQPIQDEEKKNMQTNEIDNFSEFSTISKRNLYEKLEKAIESNPNYYKHITGMCNCKTTCSGACNYSRVFPVIKNSRLFGVSTYSKDFTGLNKDLNSTDDDKANFLGLNDDIWKRTVNNVTSPLKEDMNLKYCSITKSDFVRQEMNYEKPKRFYQIHCKPDGQLRLLKSSYQQDFLNYGANPVSQVKIKEKPTVISDLPFISETTYKREFRSYDLNRKSSVEFSKLPHPLDSSMPLQNETSQRLAFAKCTLSPRERFVSKPEEPLKTLFYDGSYQTSQKLDYQNHYQNHSLDFEEFQKTDKDKEIRVLKEKIRQMIKSNSRKSQL